MQYLSRFSVRGVVSMRSKEKFGSSLATVTKRSLAIMVVSHLGFGFPSSHCRLPCPAATQPAAAVILFSAAVQEDGEDESGDAGTRFRREPAADVPVLPPPPPAPTRNFEIRSFCVACLFGWWGALVWLGSFCRRACERTLRRVSSLRAMVLMEVMNWKPGFAPLAVAAAAAAAAAAGGGEDISGLVEQTRGRCTARG